MLAAGGRLLAVVPNRRGIWARIDSTPFGQGQPYTPGQLSRLLREEGFTPERTAAALFVPPTRSRMMLRSAVAWEKIGERWFTTFAGVAMVEATKQIYAKPAPAARRVRARQVYIPLATAPRARSGGKEAPRHCEAPEGRRGNLLDHASRRLLRCARNDIACSASSRRPRHQENSRHCEAPEGRRGNLLDHASRRLLRCARNDIACSASSRRPRHQENSRHCEAPEGRRSNLPDHASRRLLRCARNDSACSASSRRPRHQENSRHCEAPEGRRSNLPDHASRRLLRCARNDSACGASARRPRQQEQALLGQEIGEPPVGLSEKGRPKRSRVTLLLDADARPRRTARGSRGSCRDGCWASRTTAAAGACVIGMRPRSSRSSRMRQWPKFGKRDDGAPADAHEMVDHAARVARRLQRLAQHDVVEGVGGIGVEIVVGVALDHRQAVAHAGIDARSGSAPCRGRRRPCRGRDRTAARRRRSRRRGRASPARSCSATRRRSPRMLRGVAGPARRRCASGLMASRGRDAAAQPSRKPRKRGEEFRLVEQEGVVALVGLDLDEAHIGGDGVERMHDRRGSRSSG